VQTTFLWCGCAGSSFDVKVETDSNDAAMTESDSYDVTEFPHDDKPSTGMFCTFLCCILYGHP